MFLHSKNTFFIPLLQVEFHPQLCQAELRSVCQEYGVCFQAYTSLGQGELLNDPVVFEVARSCERSPAQVQRFYTPMTSRSRPVSRLVPSIDLCPFPICQVLLRWAVQQGVPVLPKSSNPERIRGNAMIFDFSFSDSDMEKLSGLDCNHRYCWDPSEVA